jgi:hypothetical protein
MKSDGRIFWFGRAVQVEAGERVKTEALIFLRALAIFGRDGPCGGGARHFDTPWTACLFNAKRCARVRYCCITRASS